jgi:hypothetical protein
MMAMGLGSGGAKLVSGSLDFMPVPSSVLKRAHGCFHVDELSSQSVFQENGGPE